MKSTRPNPIKAVLRGTACFLLLTLNASAHAGAFFGVTPYTPGDDPSAWQWMFTQEDGPTGYNPTLLVNTGDTYYFEIYVDSMHPEQTHTFWIDNSPGLGGLDPYYAGLSTNGVEGGTGLITMNLPADAPDVLYYSCSEHASMAGTIAVNHDLLFRNGFN